MKNEPLSAVYLRQAVLDYCGNPLIEALPPIYSGNDAVSLLTFAPPYHEAERELDAHDRIQSVWRLFRYFQPLMTHIDIEQRISIAIRQGYISRNPIQPAYAEKLSQGAEAVRNKSQYLGDFYTGNTTSVGFTIIGLSGIGKTTGIQRVLSMYPQTIRHTQYNGESLYLNQLVWAKLDCPFDGSIKGLCFDFFGYVDRVLGTDYSKKFSVTRMTVDMALPRMAQIANAHCLGLLVIDEIQHLSQARSGGQAKMLNFFVTLVNTVGVPVVLIGTAGAMSVLQGEFRQARRSSAQGALIWDRMQNDESWDIMLRAMWRYQWLQKATPLTVELKNALYDESQGILDIAVKLYAMAQSKAIADGIETITPQTIREVVGEKLHLVKPMLKALRDGDAKKLAQYEDIRLLDVDAYITAQLSRLPTATEVIVCKEIRSLEEEAIVKLLEMDIPSKTARLAVRKVIRQVSMGQPLSGVVKKAFRIALNMEDRIPETAQVPQESDLRRTTQDNVYDNLKTSGVMADADEF
jgi:GTPase SAR1 family protein